LVPLKEIRSTSNKELRIFGMEAYITTGTILFSRRHTELLEQLKYFPGASMMMALMPWKWLCVGQRWAM
jgi:hypothetical protein